MIRPTGSQALTDNLDAITWLSAQPTEEIEGVVAELDAQPRAQCNPYCLKLARQILKTLGHCLDENERHFCESTIRWMRSRKIAYGQIAALHVICRAAAQRALLIDVAPANTRPI